MRLWALVGEGPPLAKSPHLGLAPRRPLARPAPQGPTTTPRWRNGRRRGLKILRAQAHAGSSPALGIIQNLEWKSKVYADNSTQACARVERQMGELYSFCTGHLKPAKLKISVDRDTLTTVTTITTRLHRRPPHA